MPLAPVDRQKETSALMQCCAYKKWFLRTYIGAFGHFAKATVVIDGWLKVWKYWSDSRSLGNVPITGAVLCYALLIPYRKHLPLSLTPLKIRHLSLPNVFGQVLALIRTDGRDCAIWAEEILRAALAAATYCGRALFLRKRS